MKIAFSTLGCPDWTWKEIVSTAKDLGYDGIEVRGVENEIKAYKTQPFSDEEIDKTLDVLADLKLEIPCLSSGAYLFDEDNHLKAIIEAKNYIDLASKIRAPYVRVLGDKSPNVTEEINDDYVLESLNFLSEYSSGKYVTLLIETNGVYANSKRLYNLLNRFNYDNVGVLWDVHHPYRYFNEDVTETYETLKDYIKYVHIKDSVMIDNNVQYKMIGQGDVPIVDAIDVLRKNSYNGYISLEWVKRWNMELEDPGVVFAHFIDYASELIEKEALV